MGRLRDSSWRRYAWLLAALAGVYAAMAVLSAVDTSAGWNRPSEWRWQVPMFIAVAQPDGSWAFNSYNQSIILKQAAVNVTLAVGMTLVILAGGIDLSVGSLLALCNVVFVQVALGLGATGPPTAGQLLAGLAVSVVLGLACGAANGWLSVHLRIPSFIVTLGTLLVARGVAFWLSGGQTRTLMCPPALAARLPVVIPLLAAAAAGVFLSLTVWGRHIYAVGGNLLACEYSGIRTSRVRILCFAASGACAGLAGVVYWARVASGSHLAGEGAELYAIAAVVLGGTRLSGGEGSVVGTLLGALIMAVLANGLDTAAVDASTQKIIVGTVLIAAAWLDSRRGGVSLAEVR